MTYEPVADSESFAGRNPMCSTSFVHSSEATAIWLLESIPTVWDDHDIRFFGCVFDVFPQAFALGASVLLASYDKSSSI
jgi:hypothetical protein